jgi:thiol-disulfide isomerase/thioredoxin
VTVFGTGARHEHWLRDYQEVAPDCWLPMTQGYALYDIDEDGKPYETVRRELKITEAQVNPTLSDDMFVIQFTEGVKVTNFTHDPPLFYRYKANMSKEEWATILKEAEERGERVKRERESQDSLVGKDVPAFPKGKWLNSKPLTWADLAGKVVLLDFWSISCGPCRPHLPQMNRMHRMRQQTKVIVIGVHAAESDIAPVEKFVREKELSYPIFIESAEASGPPSFGEFFDGFGVRGIPHACVVNQKGKIAVEGSWMLESAWVRARNIAASPD